MTTERPLSAASEALLKTAIRGSREARGFYLQGADIWLEKQLAAIEAEARAAALAEVARLREALGQQEVMARLAVRAGITHGAVIWREELEALADLARAALSQPAEGQE